MHKQDPRLGNPRSKTYNFLCAAHENPATSQFPETSKMTWFVMRIRYYQSLSLPSFRAYDNTDRDTELGYSSIPLLELLSLEATLVAADYALPVASQTFIPNILLNHSKTSQNPSQNAHLSCAHHSQSLTICPLFTIVDWLPQPQQDQHRIIPVFFGDGVCWSGRVQGRFK